MASRDDRIANLAATLKAAGLAKSEVQARMMAEEMIGVEENVQKRYDEEHAKAHEYLKTAKNLGDSRQKVQPPKIEQITSPRKIEPIQRIAPQKSIDEIVPDKKIVLDEVNTDISFGKGTLKDLMLNQIKEDNHPVQNIEEIKQKDSESFSEEDIVSTQNIQNIHDPAQIVNPLPIEIKDEDDSGFFSDEKISEIEKEQSEVPVVEDAPVSEEMSPDELPDPDEEKFFSDEDADTPGPEKVEVPVPESELDGQKLQELMEEDGPMEEHTREIKEKPKVIKPKEEYAENSVDLGNIFNVNK